MGAENRHRAGRHRIDVLDENSALVLQAIDDMLVVDDFMADIDGPAVYLQGPLNDIDGAHDAGAKPARFCEQNL